MGIDLTDKRSNALGWFGSTRMAAIGLRTLLELRPDGQRMAFLVAFFRDIPIGSPTVRVGLYYRDDDSLEIKLRRAAAKIGAVPVLDPESGDTLWTLHPGEREVVKARAITRLPTREQLGKPRLEPEAKVARAAKPRPAPKRRAPAAPKAPRPRRKTLPHSERTQWTRELCLAALARWIAEHGEQPRCDDWRSSAPGHPCNSTVQNRFGSWTAFLRIAGLKPRAPGGDTLRIVWTRERIIEAMRRWAAEHDGQGPSQTDWETAGEWWPSRSSVQTHFGSFLTARAEAGVERDPVRHVWDQESIIAAIRRWVSERGQVPSSADWSVSNPGYPTKGSVKRHFGRWSVGIRAAGFEPLVGGRPRARRWAA